MALDLLPVENEFTKADGQIMEFITSHPDEFLFMSIGQLAGIWACPMQPFPALPAMWAAVTLKN